MILYTSATLQTRTGCFNREKQDRKRKRLESRTPPASSNNLSTYSSGAASFLTKLHGRYGVHGCRASGRLRVIAIEGQLLGLVVAIDYHTRTQPPLASCRQTGERVHKEALDRAFQVARTVSIFDPFAQQKLARRVCKRQCESLTRAFVDTLLNA